MHQAAPWWIVHILETHCPVYNKSLHTSAKQSEHARQGASTHAGILVGAQRTAPLEAWTALGGFLLATLLHWVAARITVGLLSAG